MREVVWVVGSSNAGKRTFIKRVVSDPVLAKRLGWQSKKLAYCKVSVDMTGDLGMPEVVKARKRIPGDVRKLLAKNDVVLIKWQYIDSSCETPQELKRSLPKVRHRIILLQADPEELSERLNSQDWWQDMGVKNTHELVRHELPMVDKFMSDMQGEFDVVKLDSSRSGNYKHL